MLGGLLLVGMLVVLVAALASLEGTRSELRTTRIGVTEAEQRFERVTVRLRPLLDATAPLSRESSRQDLRRAGETVADAAGEIPALAEDARRGLNATAYIAQTVQASDLGGSLTAVRMLSDALLPVARELNQVGGRSLAACDARLRTLAPSADGQIGCLLAVVPNVRQLLRSQRSITSKSLTTQRSTLTLTREIHALFVKSLTIQQELLERTRSLDRKTGGPAPGTPVDP